jgi:hypothetical protein
MRLSWIIIAENPDGSVPAHTKGRKGNLPVMTHIQSFRMSGSLDELPDAPATGHPFCHFIPCSGRPVGFTFEP